MLQSGNYGMLEAGKYSINNVDEKVGIVRFEVHVPDRDRGGL